MIRISPVEAQANFCTQDAGEIYMECGGLAAALPIRTLAPKSMIEAPKSGEASLASAKAEASQPRPASFRTPSNTTAVWIVASH